MPKPASPQPSGDPASIERVRLAIQHLQRAHATWNETAHQPLEHEVARLQLRLAQEQLLPLIADTLLQVARQWVGSTFGRSLASVDDDAILMSFALTLYLEVIEELFNIQIDPSKNPLSLIKTIAHRRLTDRYRREKHQSGLRAALRSTNATAPSETPEQEVVDLESLDLEEVLVNRLDNEALVEEIWAFWRITLTSEDQQIMRHREKDPPTPFKELAVLLGPGWTEGMVKMRHHRVIERTRKYFKRRQPP